MKLFNLKLTAFLILSLILFSCSTEEGDDDIYSEQSSEKVITENITYTTIEIEILNLVNAHRQSIGLSTLQSLDIISGVAEGHTNYMIETGEVSHDNFATRSEQLIKDAHAISVGENVGYGYGTAEGVVNGWLNSEGHRKIIENSDYTHFGISTELDSKGRNYFTQIFINK